MASPPTSDTASNYRLSDEQSQQILTTRIIPAELPPRRRPVSDPQSLLLVGQTGSGKSRLSSQLLSALARQGGDRDGVAHLVADTFKTYHPAYAHVASSSSSRWASVVTGPDARRWLLMAAEEVVRRRAHVLVESACRHAVDFVQLVTLFREARYRLVVLVMAVPEGLSRLGIAVRFFVPAPERSLLEARLTPAAVHDESYRGLIEAAAFLDENPAVTDRLLVVRRGGLVVPCPSEGALVTALRTERERPLTEEESSRATDDLERLAGFDGAKDLLHDIRTLLRPLMGQGTDRSQFSELMPLEIAVAGEERGGYNVLQLGGA
ncbi:hypothetical protein XA68_10770 [Ophiocordyceps unilateralis]|uniref:Zeta toxin domain-containing protein n=1 Tax=Ophiocordyceps unilateralis TaxID=268505 RepID=A0A2A9PGE3_OPHUN|nr:hypothetical protein XA68_10770 [Ophiocordyceps unilateralis]